MKRDLGVFKTDNHYGLRGLCSMAANNWTCKNSNDLKEINFQKLPKKKKALFIDFSFDLTEGSV